MICPRCGRNVRPDRYCSHCRAPLPVTFCGNCGGIMLPGERRCPQCGYGQVRHSEYGNRGYDGYRASYGQGRDGFNDGYRRDAGRLNSNRMANRKPTASELNMQGKRTGLQTMICFLFGIATLVLMGIVTYVLLFRNLFVNETGGVIGAFEGAYNTEGSTSIVSNIKTYFMYFPDKIKMIIDAITVSQDKFDTIRVLIENDLMEMLLVLAMLLASVLCICAFVFGVLAFFVAMGKGKFFTLTKTSGLTLFSSLLIFLVARLRDSYFLSYVGMSSGIMLMVILSFASIAMCVIANLLFAGSRLAKSGSIFKVVTNLLILGCAIGAYFMFTGFIAEYNPFIAVFELVQANNMVMPLFALRIATAVFTLVMLFCIPGFVARSASRLGNTFKFDGNEDKAFVRASVLFFFGMALLVGPVIAIHFMKLAEIAISVKTYVFAGMAVGALLFAGINKAVLNKDQL